MARTVKLDRAREKKRLHLALREWLGKTLTRGLMSAHGAIPVSMFQPITVLYAEMHGVRIV
jgi:hypothetical protein